MATTGKRLVLDGRPSIPAALDLQATRAAVDQIRTRLEKLDVAVNRAYTTLDASSPQKAMESLQRQITILSKQLDDLADQVDAATDAQQPTYLAVQMGDDAEDGHQGQPGPQGPKGDPGYMVVLEQDQDDVAHFVIGPPGERGPAGPQGGTLAMDLSECCVDDFPVGFSLSGIASTNDQTVPYYIPLGDTYSVAENKQALFRMPITVAGNLSVAGYLIEV